MTLMDGAPLSVAFIQDIQNKINQRLGIDWHLWDDHFLHFFPTHPVFVHCPYRCYGHTAAAIKIHKQVMFLLLRVMKDSLSQDSS